MKNELKNFDEKILAAQSRANELGERAEQIKLELTDAQNQVLHAESESEIEEVFEKIESLRKEQRQSNLLLRRAEIETNRLQVDKLKTQIQEKREIWEDVFSQLPEKHEAVELAIQALTEQENRVKVAENILSNLERQLLTAETSLNSSLTIAPTECFDDNRLQGG